MAYINISTAALKWGITARRVQELCKKGRIKGAARFGRAWMIPEDAEKPADGRIKAANQPQKGAENGFLFPRPKQNPFLIHTDLYNTAGTADEVVAMFSDYPETQSIIKNQFDCRKGDIDAVYKNIDSFLDKHQGFYSTISAGINLSFCAIWKGDINLWNKARQHIYNAPRPK